jgi:hypothetical protein
MSLILQPWRLFCMILADCQGTRAFRSQGTRNFTSWLGVRAPGAPQALGLPVIERPLAGSEVPCRGAPVPLVVLGRLSLVAPGADDLGVVEPEPPVGPHVDRHDMVDGPGRRQ